MTAADKVVRTPRRVLVITLITFALALAVGGAFVRLVDRRSIEARRGAASEAAAATALRIEKQIDAAFATAATVSALLRTGSEIAAREAAASAIARGDVAAVELQARVPVAGAEELSVLTVDNAQQVRAQVRITKGEPQFAESVIEIRELQARSGLTELQEKDYDYRLTASDPRSGRQVVIARSTPMEFAEPVKASFDVPQGRWTLQLVRRSGWRLPAERAREIAIAVIASLLFSLFIYDLLRRPYVLEREVELRTRRIAETNRKLTAEIEQRRRAEEQVVHESTHDRLTSLPNRVYLLDRISRALERTRVTGKGDFAVLVVDIDRFTDVNDGLGHGVGDELLTIAARRLQSCIRFDDVLARVGGDEFAILAASVEPTGVSGIARRAHEALTLPFDVQGHRVQMSGSIGITLSQSGYAVGDELLRDAYLAVQRARQEGGGREVMFDRRMHEQAVAAQQIESDLRSALQNDELRPYFQPIVSLASGRITGFEALVRWVHPARGFISPAAFIPVAVSSGLIIPLDQWMMRAAARQVHDWNTRFAIDPPLTISVNVSGRRLGQRGLLDDVAETLRETGVGTRSLRLEITEGEMMEHPEEVLSILNELKRMDITLLVDDFGTGYSSLSYLHSFPIDIVKIDQSFVRRMLESAKDEEIVRAVINLSATLALRVVAEGIETEAHLTRLRELGCDYGQGYFFSKPVDAAAVEMLLTSSPSW